MDILEDRAILKKYKQILGFVCVCVSVSVSVCLCVCVVVEGRTILKEYRMNEGFWRDMKLGFWNYILKEGTVLIRGGGVPCMPLPHCAPVSLFSHPIMLLSHYAPIPNLTLAYKRLGAQWGGDTMRWRHSEMEGDRLWDGDTLGLGHNGMGT